MAYLKIVGVYKIHCRGNGKFYVGSAVSINGRWASHRSSLQRGRHSNKHLQNAWNKYGADSFEFSILERCELDTLIEREQYWIDAMCAADPKIGMNNSPTASTSIGFRHSEETKKLLSELASKRDHPHLRAHAEACRGKPGYNKGLPGKKWTDEQRAQASEQRKGRQSWNVGIPMKEDVKRRISEKWKERASTDPARAKACELRATGMFYTDISRLLGISIAQVHRYSKHIPVGPRRGLRTVEKVKGAA